MKIEKIRKKREIDAPYFCLLGKAYKEDRIPSQDEWDSCDIKEPHRHCICMLDQSPTATSVCSLCKADELRHAEILNRISRRNQNRLVAV